MNRYAIIPIDLYDFDTLTEVYPVNIEYGNYQMLEYTTESDPIGDGWVIFDGDTPNIDCMTYINTQ